MAKSSLISDTHPLKKELNVSLQLVLQAGSLAIIQVAKGFGVEKKTTDGSPVTDIDRAVNRFLTEELENLFPEDTVIGEESTPASQRPKSTSARTWYLDPIDGTKDLIRGTGEWSIILGLCENQKPILGMVFQPTTQRLWYAIKGQGAYLIEDAKTHTSKKIQSNDLKKISDLTLIRSKSHPEGKAMQLSQHLGVSKNYSHGSIGIKIAHIAEGKADLYFNFSGRCHHWDLCGSHILLQEAGGEVFSLSSSEPISYPPTDLQINEPFAAAPTHWRSEIYQQYGEFLRSRDSVH